ncbi:MAG: hypothetical protein ACRC28_01385 [Clostridium sp.]|uniref:hypothetical protein n=1 Tax=Clostridium sp. TaxID=1506 RepID=UPI003F404E5E
MDEAIGKAEEKIEYLSGNEDAMRIYYERERSLHERANMISSAERNKQVEIATNALNEGLEVNLIATLTGLTLEDISKIKLK